MINVTCTCRCGYTCGRQCGMDIMDCMKAHYVNDCEHVWDGEFVESDSMASATCSKCGMLAIDHSLRCGP